MAIAAGHTSKKAARELGVAPDTIDKRLLALTTKLGVTRRAALVAEAFKRGLISPAILALCAVLVGQSITSTEEFTRIRRPGEAQLPSSLPARRVRLGGGMTPALT